MSTSTTLPMSSWSPRRKAAAGVFGLLTVAVLSLAATYLAGVLFLVLNRVSPRHAQLTSVIIYWEGYSDDPPRRKQLVVSIAVAAATLLLVPIAAVIATRPCRRVFGDARFATLAEVRDAGLLDVGRDRGPSILVGRYRGQFLALPGQLSVMLSAPTRSGKGVGVVVPNLLNWPDSVVVLDIKGENYEITAGFRRAHSQAVYAFSPFDEEARSHRWNPLTAVRTSPFHRVGDLLAIGQSFFPGDGGTTSAEAFFNDQARNLFLGLGLFLLESPELPRTIGEMLRQSSGKGQPFKDHLAGAIAQRAKDGKPLSDECVDALHRLLVNSENTLSSIVSTFNAPLTIFADAIVDAATSADDFRLEDVRRRHMSIYVRIPPNRLASARPLLNLFFSQLVSLNTQRLPAHDPNFKLHCLLVNDEFAAMGRIGVISTGAAFLAGYNLRLLTVVQAMSQLDAVYGDKEARTFATNHGLQILYAPREQRDADEYSAMLGHFTGQATSRARSRSFSQHSHTSVGRTESEQRRALLLPQEFKELGPERLVVIFENCKPILAEKIRYHRDKVFTDRVLAPPAVPPMDMDLHIAKAQQRWRFAPDVLADGEDIDVDRLAHDFSDLPDIGASGGAANADAFTEGFFAVTLVRSQSSEGGAIEPAAAEPDRVAAAEAAVELG